MSDQNIRPGWLFQVGNSEPLTFDDFNFTESMNNVLRELYALGSLLEFYGCQEEVSDHDTIYGAGMSVCNRVKEIEQLLDLWHKQKTKTNLTGIDGGAS